MSAKKRTATGKVKKATPATGGDDFFDETMSRMFDAMSRQWDARKAKFYADADLLAVSAGIDTADPEAVRAYLKQAMRDYSEAVHADTPGEIGGKRDLLPNDDWRIIHARRDGNEVAAAMLYWEAAAAVREIRRADEIEKAELAQKPKRGRPKSKEGRRSWKPNAEKRLAAIVIIERVRGRKNSSIAQAITYCQQHEMTPPQTKEPGDGGADYEAFDADAQFGRWAKFNGTTATELKELLRDEWEARKTTLQ